MQLLSRFMVLALSISSIGCEEQISKQGPGTAKAKANAEAEFQSTTAAVGTTAGVEPKDGEILTNQFGMRFVRIPAAEVGVSSDSIPGFFLQETELCYQEWHAAMVAMGEWEPSHSPPDVPRPPIPVGYSINFWHEADAFINKLNRFDEQHNYRMPTEAEWLHACFAGRSQEQPLVRNPNDSQRNKNAFGLYDMLGGNGEFCSNLFVDDAYLTGSEDTQRHANAHVIRGMHVPKRGYRTDTRTPTRRNTDPWLINGLRLVIEHKQL